MPTKLTSKGRMSESYKGKEVYNIAVSCLLAGLSCSKNGRIKVFGGHWLHSFDQSRQKILAATDVIV